MLAKLFRPTNHVGNERYRRAALTTAMNVASQAIQMATGLISVPLALNYVGVERFGIWMTLSTALAFITFSDFGVGIGTQDRMSKLSAVGSYGEARDTFTSSMLFAVVLAVLLMAISWFVVPHLGLAALFSLKSEAAIRDIVPTALMVVFVFALGLVAGIVQRAYAALQDGFFIALMQAVSRVLSLALLFAVVSSGMGLPALVFVVGGVSSAAIIAIGAPVLLRRYPWLRPERMSIAAMFDRECFRDVLKIGLLGLGASVAIYLVNNSALVLISAKHGAASSADYAVLLKLIGIPLMVLTYGLLPLWPAIAEANAKRDFAWIGHAYGKYKRITLAITVVSAAGILLFGRPAIAAWTRNADVVPSTELLLASTGFMVLGFWNALTSVFLNGLSKYRSQATVGLLLAFLSVVAAALVPERYGKEAIIWIIGCGYFLRCLMMQVQVGSFLRASEISAKAETVSRQPDA